MKKKIIEKLDEDVLVIDNCIPEEEQDRIEEFCMSAIIPWTYTRRATYGMTNTLVDNIMSNKDRVRILQENGWLTNTFEPCQFVHTITDSTKGLPGINSPGFNHFISVFKSIPTNYIGLARAKINYCHPHPECPKGAWSPPHVDFINAPPGTKIVLYYINDSDGDTVIFDQNLAQFNDPNCKDPLTIKATVSPKKGRMVMFDGSLVHAAGIPRKNSCRLVVNINLYKPYSD